MKEKVAIIGGGIGGLTAGYLLDERYDVTLFEKDGRLGGNAYTLETRDGETLDVSVFAFSKKSYPNFFKLLSGLKIEYDATAVLRSGVTYYDLQKKKVQILAPLARNPRWSAHGIPTALKVGTKILSGVKQLDEGKLEGLTTQEALGLIPGIKGDTYFRMVGIICLAASMLFEEVLKSPATFFFGKLKHHFMAGDFAVMKNRTQRYIQAMADTMTGRIVLNSTIKSIFRSEKKVAIRMNDGKIEEFQKVVFACNADQVLNLVENPTEAETNLLGAWRYKDGLVVVHQDYSSFPKKSRLRLYSYLYTQNEGEYQTSINATYGQQNGVSRNCQYLGTQHPNFPIDEKLVEFKKVFRTPIYDAASFATISRLPSLNGKMNTYYCGSHFGFGLHEDAVRSAVAVASELGVR